MTTIDVKFDRDKFLVNQKRLSIKEKYYVYDEGRQGLFYVGRPFRFFGRRNIHIYGDDSKTELLLSVNQDHFGELIHRNYTVCINDGTELAKLSRNNITSLFRRGWSIRDPHGSLLAKALEDSVAMAVFRRVVDLIPFVSILGLVIRTNFHFLVPEGDESHLLRIGTFNRRFTIFDKYVLDLSEDHARALDRRVALAVGILLDTAEKR